MQTCRHADMHTHPGHPAPSPSCSISIWGKSYVSTNLSLTCHIWYVGWIPSLRGCTMRQRICHNIDLLIGPDSTSGAARPPATVPETHHRERGQGLTRTRWGVLCSVLVWAVFARCPFLIPRPSVWTGQGWGRCARWAGGQVDRRTDGQVSRWAGGLRQDGAGTYPNACTHPGPH